MQELAFILNTHLKFIYSHVYKHNFIVSGIAFAYSHL